MKKFMYGIIAIAIIFGFTGCEKAQPYPVTIKSWKSYKDVASWMQNNWHFSADQRRIKNGKRKYLKQGGDIRDMRLESIAYPAEKSYDNQIGHCGDAALLIKDSLNKINPNYHAKIIFIKNTFSPHHWVTGFYLKDDLYVMDYGAGPKWSSMKGVHGPYKSIDGYKDFLNTLNISNFKPVQVIWRD